MPSYKRSAAVALDETAVEESTLKEEVVDKVPSLREEVARLDVVCVIVSSVAISGRIPGGSFNNGPQGIVMIRRSDCPPYFTERYDGGVLVAEEATEMKAVLDLIAEGKALSLSSKDVKHANVSQSAAEAFDFGLDDDEEENYVA